VTKSFRKGDQVSWDTSQGRTHGNVERKLTSETQVKGQKISASEDDPRYLVKSDKTGELAAHKPKALKRRG
jgi:hypothetical protein